MRCSRRGAAVEKAEKMSFARRNSLSKSGQKRVRKTYLALALSNRGVLHAATGDVELARQDFTAALSIKTSSKVTKLNLARLGEVEAKKV